MHLFGDGEKGEVEEEEEDNDSQLNHPFITIILRIYSY